MQVLLTFVQTRLVEALNEAERSFLIVCDGFFDERAQLFRHFIANQTKSSYGRFIVGDDPVLLETSASKLVKILARIHAQVHVFQQFGS